MGIGFFAASASVRIRIGMAPVATAVGLVRAAAGTDPRAYARADSEEVTAA